MPPGDAPARHRSPAARWAAASARGRWRCRSQPLRGRGVRNEHGRRQRGQQGKARARKGVCGTSAHLFWRLQAGALCDATARNDSVVIQSAEYSAGKMRTWHRPAARHRRELSRGSDNGLRNEYMSTTRGAGEAASEAAGRIRVARVRIEDVAEQAGVSMKTVSRVLNNEPNVSVRTRTLVEAVVEELALPAAAIGARTRRAALTGGDAVRQSLEQLPDGNRDGRAGCLPGAALQPDARAAGVRRQRHHRQGRGAGDAGATGWGEPRPRRSPTMWPCCGAWRNWGFPIPASRRRSRTATWAWW